MFPLQDESRRPSRPPVVTGSIIALNVLVFILELTPNRATNDRWLETIKKLARSSRKALSAALTPA